MTENFKGKVALVTGGASGIGAAVARQLAAGGAKVVVADRDLHGAEAVANGITAAGGTAVARQVNVADPIEVEAMVAFAVKTYGALHLAVNNAGVAGASGPTVDYPLNAWREVMSVDLDGVFFGLKYEIPAIIAAGGGAIVNMASIAGILGFAQSPAYVAAKHGVVGLTKTAALENAAHGVRINSVGPGVIETPMVTEHVDHQMVAAITALHPIGRMGKPDEVAALTCFLLSDGAAFITGSYHLVDGGYSAQ